MTLAQHLLQYSTVEDLQRQHPTDIVLQSVEVATDYNTIDRDYAREYCLKATLGVVFKATDEYYAQALEEARQKTLRYVYGPLLRFLPEIRGRAYAGDTRGVIGLVDELENMMIGGGHVST